MKAVCRALTVLLSLAGLAGPASSDTAQERLKELHRTLMDPDRMFSISATLAELDELERKIGADDLQSQGGLNYLRGFVLHKAGRYAESLPPSLKALRIDETVRFLPDRERTRLIYDIADRGEEIGDWEIAIKHFRQAMPLFDAAAEYTEDQRLGLRERLAFCLHEAGQYTDALALNREVFSRGEKLFGPESRELFNVLTNLAQNAHALGELPTAREYLERLLALGTKLGNQHQIDTALFQLGVLSYEQGRFDEAEAFMKRRLALAQASGNSDRIDNAQEDLEILFTKMRR